MRTPLEIEGAFISLKRILIDMELTPDEFRSELAKLVQLTAEEMVANNYDQAAIDFLDKWEALKPSKKPQSYQI